ncbi:MAG: GGDEF domain-containing phosphodiesterase [Asticcacaulis sp.]
MTDDLKSQRDRYLAFSLAAADLLIETDSQHCILKTTGATQTLLRGSAAEMTGRPVQHIFSPADRAFSERLFNRARTTGRIEPCCLTLNQEPPLLVNMGVCCLGGANPNLYISLTVLSDAMLLPPGSRDVVTGLLNRDAYEGLLSSALSKDEEQGERYVRLIRLEGLMHAMRGLTPESADTLLTEISSVLRTQAVGGAAARLSEENFSYLAANPNDADANDILTRDIQAVAVAAGLAEDSLKPTLMNLELSTGNMDADSVARALQYVLNDFCKPEKNHIGSLEQGLKAAMADTVKHFDSIRSLIDSNDYTLFYQPVVKLEDRNVHHYEALLRFPEGRSPYDTIRLSEQLGLVQDFDLAITKQALDKLIERPDVSIAVNLSGLSVQNQAFRESLRQLVAPHKDISQRLMFELTESNAIEDLEIAGNFLRWLRRGGFRVCLDDFGAGAATYAYLRNFDFDFVKVDGPFLNESRGNSRQRALIRSISQLCRDLHSGVVAEMIEDEATVKHCIEMGIEFGQGFHLGRPKADIDMPREMIVGKRKGFSESWS